MYPYVFEIKVALTVCVLIEHPLKYMLMEVWKISLKHVGETTKLKTKPFSVFKDFPTAFNTGVDG